MILTRFLTCSALALTLAACGGSPSKPNAEASKILPTIGSSGRAQQHSGQEAFWRESRRVTAVFRRLRQLFKGLCRGAQQLAETGPTLA